MKNAGREARPAWCAWSGMELDFHGYSEAWSVQRASSTNKPTLQQQKRSPANCYCMFGDFLRL
jgi:hypothetical protein